MITRNSVVSIHCTLKDEQGNIMEFAEDKTLEYLHGHDNLFPALEKAIEPLNVGERTHVKLTPEEAYGHYDPEKRFVVGRDEFGEDVPEPGMMVAMYPEDGDEPIEAHIVKVEGDDVYLDGNHPLSGQTLFFDIEVTEVRDATPEEIAHGHAHGAHGHSH